MALRQCGLPRFSMSKLAALARWLRPGPRLAAGFPGWAARVALLLLGHCQRGETGLVGYLGSVAPRTELPPGGFPGSWSNGSRLLQARHSHCCSTVQEPERERGRLCSGCARQGWRPQGASRLAWARADSQRNEKVFKVIGFPMVLSFSLHFARGRWP